MTDKEKKLKKSAEQKTLQAKKEMDLFFGKHIINSNDPIIIVLKSHLYIENCLDRMLSRALPFPNKILKKTFSNKVDFFEALNLACPPDPNSTEVVFKLRQINKIRNKLAHNLDKKITKKDIEGLMKGVTHKKGATIPQKLIAGLSHFIGYFHCLLSLNDFFPFFSAYERNKNNFKQDIGWDDKLFLLTYRIADMRTILKFGKMKKSNNSLQRT